MEPKPEFSLSLQARGNYPPFGAVLSASDWENTPIAVQQLVLLLLAENPELKARLSVIEDLLKQTSFRSQSLASSQFVARLLSVVTSLKAQGRHVWDFLTSVCRTARFDLEMPSLIPLNPLSL